MSTPGNKNASILETKKTIEKVLESAKNVNVDINDISEKFDKIDKSYNDYEGEVDFAEKQLKELKLR